MLLAGVSFLLSLPFVLASLVNVTIDDKFGDPQTGTQIVYLPPGTWNNGTNSCSGCITHLDPSQLYNGTWHDSTFDPQPSNNDSKSSQIQTASVTFNGQYFVCLGRTELTSLPFQVLPYTCTAPLRILPALLMEIQT
jgi:hypothetical protein